jgi:probable F420-dependent oxidoreductase
MTIELGRFGLWTSYRAIGEDNAAEAAQLAERLGYGTVWVGGSLSPARVTPLLAATERLTVATGITNVWQDEPHTVAAERAQLQSDYTDRFMLGIGIGHPEATSDYTRPLKAMREFLDGLDSTQRPVPPAGRMLAALGPKMLDLARERSGGTHTYFVGVQHTRSARQRVGPDRLVAPELACVLDTDVERARATARQYAKLYLGLGNYTSNLLRHGFEESDIADGGSDRLIDAVIPHGSAQDIAGAAREHLDAGADHVCLQTIGVSGVPVDDWTALAAALGLSG